MIELKPCPFCPDGKAIPNTKSEEGDRYNCSSPGCYLGEPWREYGVHIENWNTRPIEDAQASRIAILEMAVRALREIEWVECGYDGELLTCPRCSGMHPDTGDGDIKVYNLGKRGHAQDCPWLTSGELLEAK